MWIDYSAHWSQQNKMNNHKRKYQATPNAVKKQISKSKLFSTDYSRKLVENSAMYC